MDFDIGTLIYIIVTIVAVIAGAAGKKKKPVATGAPTESSEAESQNPGFFKKLEDQLGNIVDEAKSSVQEITDEFKPSSEQPVDPFFATPVQEEVEERHHESLFDQYEGLFDPDAQENQELMESEAVRSTDAGEILHAVEVDEYEHPDYFEIVKDFDLGTAVVYSTIISRPEY